MAKKKAASSTKSKAASRSAAKSAAKADGQKSAKAKQKPAPAAKQNGMSDELIGHTAGEIWHTLATGGGQTLAALKKSADAPPELVLAAVGWLAREGKLEFNASGRSLKVSLR